MTKEDTSEIDIIYNINNIDDIFMFMENMLIYLEWNL